MEDQNKAKLLIATLQKYGYDLQDPLDADNHELDIPSNRTTGVCKCFDYFLSSNGAGNIGVRGDCGYISPFPTISLS